MIQTLVLRRFKRFQEERFDLTGHVVLAGPNNSGKTTVLQALAAWGLAFRHWRSVAETRSDAEARPSTQYFKRPGGRYTWAPIARQAFSAVPLGTFDLLWTHRDYVSSLEIEATLDDDTVIVFEFQPDTTEQIRIRPKQNVSPEALIAAIPQVVYVSTISGIGIEEPEYRADYIETMLGRQKPGDVLRSMLLAASLSRDWETVRQSMLTLFGVNLMVPRNLGGMVVCEYIQDGITYDIQSIGSGALQVLNLLACLARTEPAILLVDEPDAHLHVFLQDSVFHRLQLGAARSGSQLILATHAEVILDSVDPERICQLVGRPMRLTDKVERTRLKAALRVLSHSEVMAANSSPGILYLDGYTDLNLLREWASVLNHPLGGYLSRTPLWRGKQNPSRPDATEIQHQKHFEAMRLANPDLPGVWLVDSDGRARGVTATPVTQSGELGRLVWTRYEIESYLVHPAALVRFIQQKTNEPAESVVDEFFLALFSSTEFLEQFKQDPLSPHALIEGYLRNTKARSQILGELFQKAGIQRFGYTEYSEIAGQMLPGEIHPEVIEKLDFIQKAFGL